MSGNATLRAPPGRVAVSLLSRRGSDPATLRCWPPPGAPLPSIFGSAKLSVAGLVLAAGGGRRYGGPKALFRHDGTPLVQRAVATARDAGCAPIVVVLGADAAQVRAETDLSAVTVIVHEGWKAGLGASLRVGLEALAGTPTEAAVVLLVDTPGVSAESIRRVAAKSGPDALAAATYGGRRGNPVLLGRDHWAGVATLATADVGARAYLTARAELVQTVPCEDVADDTELDPPGAD